MIIVMQFILMTSCRNGGTFEKNLSTVAPTMKTEVAGVVGRLKTMSTVCLRPARQRRNL